MPRVLGLSSDEPLLLHLQRLGSGTSLCSALMRYRQAKVIWCHWEERGKGIISVPDS